MISAQIVEKKFGDKTILKDVAFEVAPGEVLAVTGKSGVGKTTLLRIVSRLDTTFSGRVACPKAVGMVFQEPNLLPWRNVSSNIQIATRASAAEIRELLHKVGLPGQEQAFPGQLSLGQQRRVALARALAMRPSALLLDEPFASLDEATANEMMALVGEMIADNKIATIFVSHAPTDVDRLATRTLHLT